MATAREHMKRCAMPGVPMWIRLPVVGCAEWGECCLLAILAVTLSSQTFGIACLSFPSRILVSKIGSIANE